MTLWEEATTINLLAIGEATVELVGDVLIPTEDYAQMRFVIDGGLVALDNGEIFATAGFEAGGGVQVGELILPSLAQSGLKLRLPEPNELCGHDANGEHTGFRLLSRLDVDVQPSLGHPAGRNRWVLRPIMRAESLEALVVAP